MDEIEEELSLDECSKILQNCFKRDDLMAKSRSVVSLSNTVEGFLGQHFLVEIQYDDDSRERKVQSFFAKILNGSLQTITSSFMAYEREVFFYDLLSQYVKYGIDTSFAPHKYLSKNYIFVLENLHLRNFTKPPASSLLLDETHLKLTLKTLAKFHVAYILFKKAKTEELGAPFSLDKESIELLKDPLITQESGVVKMWFERTLEGIRSIINVIFGQDGDYNRYLDKFEKLIADARNLNESIKAVNQVVVLHGDLWINNLLYNYADGKPVKNMFVDFQLVKLGPPAFDVLHVIFFNTRRECRDRHLSELIDYYYSNLRDCLRGVNLHDDDILPRSEYLEVCRSYRNTIKLLSICDRCTTMMPESMIDPEMPPDEGLQKFLIEDRSFLILEAFNKGGDFRDIIEEDLRELKDFLLK